MTDYAGELCDKCGSITVCQGCATLRAQLAGLTRVFDAAVSLLERGDFWQHCGTIPGKYDNLNDAVAALKKGGSP